MRSQKESGSFGIVHRAAGSQGGSDCLKLIMQKSRESGNTYDTITQLSNSIDRGTPLHFAVLHENHDAIKLICKTIVNSGRKYQKYFKKT